MADSLNPTGPSQPTANQAYTTAGNPVTQNPAERASAASTARANQHSPAVDQRIPSEQAASIDEATPSALGRGVRAPGAAGEEAKGLGTEDVGRQRELDAEQMAAPGEGRVRDAVAGGQGKTGAGVGEEKGLESDLDRKKAEQAPLREAVKEQRQHDVDVGGVLGQRGGPANPVDKGNYPNSGV